MRGPDRRPGRRRAVRARPEAAQSLGVIVAIGYAGGTWAQLNPALVVGRNVTVAGFYLGRLMQLAPEIVRRRPRSSSPSGSRGDPPGRRLRVPARRRAAAHALIEDRRHVGKVVLVP